MYFKKQLFSLLSLSILPLCAMESSISKRSASLGDITTISPRGVYVPSRLGSISLHHNEHGFTIDNGELSTLVPSYRMNKELRSINAQDLAKLLKSEQAYLSVKDLDSNGNYGLDLNHRLNGGGPIVASILSAATFLGTLFAGALFNQKVAEVVGQGDVRTELATGFVLDRVTEQPFRMNALSNAMGVWVWAFQLPTP